METRPGNQYQDLIDKAVDEGELSCQLAMIKTPPPYRAFITLISQNKRVAGNRQNPVYASIRSPYMTVDGRLKWARDEHDAQGATLDILSEFDVIGDYMTCKATAISSIKGTTIGHAPVNFGGAGVDASNPIENAETSAWGRALGAMGYGLYGTGIASANEVLSAMDEQERQRIESEHATRVQATPPPTQEKTANKGQIGIINGHLKRLGVLDGHKTLLTLALYPDGMNAGQVRDEIDTLKASDKLPGKWILEYTKLLMAECGIPREQLASSMDAMWETHDPRRLDASQQSEFIAWLSQWQPEEPQEATEIDDDDDIPEIVTPQQWASMIAYQCAEAGITADDLEKWAVDRFSDGSVFDITQLGVGVYNTINTMNTVELRAKIDEFKSESSQGELI